jgi:hypothetical protein
MRAQAQALMEQIKGFRINVTEEMKAVLPPVAEMSERTARTSHTLYGEPESEAAAAQQRPSKATRRKEPVGVAAGTGQERRHQEEEFEEF